MTDNSSLTTDLNVYPYYDDHNVAKNFHRIMFNPSRAVQARELTQLQTLSQEQIDRFAKHIFKDGSLVGGGGEFHFYSDIKFIKIKDQDVFSNNINVANLPAGTTLVGATTGVEAVVIHKLDGSEAAQNTKTLYIGYTKANGGVNEFSSTEEITSSTGITFKMINSPSSFGKGFLFEITEGLIFAHSHFIRFDKQIVVVNRYDPQATAKVGFIVSEDIVTSNDDLTLLDPAQGSYNYGAPGADRLKLTATLSVFGVDETPENFTMLFEVQGGVVISKKDKPEYSELRKEFARRTFDESGHYTVNGLGVMIKEHLNTGSNNGAYASGDGGDSTKIAIGVEPGKAYVGGFEYESLVTRWLPADKGTSTRVVQQQPISTNYGNYVIVNELTGFLNTNTLPEIKIYDTAMHRISTLGGSTISPSGSQIGTASARAIVLESGIPGTPECKWRIYIHDIKMTTGAFANARSLYYNYSGSEADFGADLVLESGSAYIKESEFHTAIFSLPTRFNKTIRGIGDVIDNSLTYLRSFNVSIGTNGQFTIDTGSDYDVFDSLGVLNSTQRLNDFVLSVNTTTDTTDLAGTVSTTTGSPTIVGSGTSFLTTVFPGDKIKIAGNVYVVASVATNTTLTSATNALATVTGETYCKRFLPGDIINLSSPNRSIDVTTTRLASFDVAETLTTTSSATLVTKLNKINAQEKRKLLRKDRYVIIDTSTHANGVTGPWSLGISDIIKVSSIRTHSSSFSTGTEGTENLSSFVLDSGARDFIYGNGSISLVPGASVSSGTKILVKLDHFEHDTSQGLGYFSVDSYPIDDTQAATATTMRTEEIPLYTSPVSGKLYDLRDSIDFRPSKTNGAASSTTIGGATTNPTASTTFVTSAGISYFPAPNENFTSDITFYLGRKDLVIIDVDGNYKLVTGVPDVRPLTPNDPENAMVLATVIISPYPSLAATTAAGQLRPDLTSSVRLTDNHRSTMRDIRVLKQRIENLEYYTSLSLLERETADIKVLDENGLDRFKNGILVDSFTGHNVADVYNADYSAAIDRNTQELRPKANIDSTKVRFDTANSTNVQINHKFGRLFVASSASFVDGETVYQGTISSQTASGFLRNRGGGILNVENVTGTWVTGQNVIGATSAASSNLVSFKLSVDSKTATLPYTHLPWIKQPLASTTRNAAGLFWSWKGEMTLNPPIDTWTDTTVAPELRVNQNGNMDAWNAITNAWGVDWGAWQTLWTGQSLVGSTSRDYVSSIDQTRFSAGGRQTNETLRITGGQAGVLTNTVVSSETTNIFNVTSGQERSGTRLVLNPTAENYNLGNRVIDTSVIPYMRSIYIKVSGHGLKPGANLYAFFDGINVSDYCTPTTALFVDSGSVGDQLVANSSGDVYFTFRIPNSTALRFTVGTKTLRLCDSPTNSASDTLTACEARFTSSGLAQTQQNTILSTQVPNLSTESVYETRVTTGTSTSITTGTRVVSTFSPDPFVQSTVQEGAGGGDPMGQSFSIETNNIAVAGVFATKIDLFFRTKHASLGCVVDIREMENGYPTNRVVPFSTVNMLSEDIAVSENGSVPTAVWFQAPVFLKNGVDYFIRIKPFGSNPEYNVWTCRLGDTDILTGQKIVSQPNSGVIFASANDTTWTPIQEEDLKFNLYIANFNTAVTGNIIVVNDDINFVSLSSKTAVFNKGQEPIKITSDVYGNTVVGTGYIYEQNADNKMSFIIETGTCVVGNYIKGVYSGGSAVIDSFDNKTLNMINVTSANLIFNLTSIDWNLRMKDTGGTLGDWQLFNMSNDTHFVNAARLIQSNKNESGIKSFGIRGELRTTTGFLSPLVDLTRFNTLMIENTINNDVSGETDPVGGTAKARYLCRLVTLKDGQDAEDLMVITSNYRPPSTDIKVYMKVLHAEDSDTFSTRPWIEMTRDTAFDKIYSSKDNLNDFKEFVYNVPSSLKTGTNGAIQYENSKGITFTGYKYYMIKIVMTGSNSASVPRVKDFRAICLQV